MAVILPDRASMLLVRYPSVTVIAFIQSGVSPEDVSIVPEVIYVSSIPLAFASSNRLCSHSGVGPPVGCIDTYGAGCINQVVGDGFGVSGTPLYRALFGLGLSSLILSHSYAN